jgi:hypothetical protein
MHAARTRNSKPALCVGSQQRTRKRASDVACEMKRLHHTIIHSITFLLLLRLLHSSALPPLLVQGIERQPSCRYGISIILLPAQAVPHGGRVPPFPAVLYSMTAPRLLPVQHTLCGDELSWYQCLKSNQSSRFKLLSLTPDPGIEKCVPHT